MERNKSELERLAHSLFSDTRELFRSRKEEVKQLEKGLLSASNIPFKEALQKLHFSEEKLRLLSPENILKRGYSITRQNGKALRKTEDVNIDEVLETQIYGGKIFSRVKNTEKNSKND